MKISFKITKSLLDQIREDLARPHPFALERVGFLFLRRGHANRGKLLVLSSVYSAIPDDQYIDDPTVGARINACAIRGAMQTILDSGAGVMHVHAHSHKGTPGFSYVDETSLCRLIPSFQNVNPDMPHGALLLSRNRITGRFWLPNQATAVISEYSVIGYPCEFFEGTTYGI